MEFVYWLVYEDVWSWFFLSYAKERWVKKRKTFNVDTILGLLFLLVNKDQTALPIRISSSVDIIIEQVLVVDRWRERMKVLDRRRGMKKMR